jgi:hypothetical protein
MRIVKNKRPDLQPRGESQGKPPKPTNLSGAVFVGLFFCLIFFMWAFQTIIVRAFGSTLIAQIDVCETRTSPRGSKDYILEYHFSLGGKTYAKGQQLTWPEYQYISKQRVLTGRGMKFLGHADFVRDGAAPLAWPVAFLLFCGGITFVFATQSPTKNSRRDRSGL